MRMPANVACAYEAFPLDVRTRLMEVRALILEVAEKAGAGPLTETLKWGQPSYLTEATGAGTTVRLGESAGMAALFVNCRTTLVDEYRTLFADILDFEGKREVRIPLEGDLPSGPLGTCIELALTYHRRKAG